MDDTDFEILRASIDQAIAGDPTARAGIAMGLGLAGEFLRRGLLQIVQFHMLIDWDGRQYRGRWVFPDPLLDDYEWAIGRPS